MSSALQRTPRPETKPQAATCPGCGAGVLHARTTAGLDVTVTAPALTTLGELAALVAGRTTYTWHRVAGHLAHRYPLVIRTSPAGSPRQTVHATHACGDDWPALPPAAQAAAPTDHPPY